MGKFGDIASSFTSYENFCAEKQHSNKVLPFGSRETHRVKCEASSLMSASIASVARGCVFYPAHLLEVETGQNELAGKCDSKVKGFALPCGAVAAE